MPTLVVNHILPPPVDTEVTHESTTLSSDDSHKLVINEGPASQEDHGQPPLLQVQLEDVGSGTDDPIINQLLSQPSTSKQSKTVGKRNRLSLKSNKQTAGE